MRTPSLTIALMFFACSGEPNRSVPIRPVGLERAPAAGHLEAADLEGYRRGIKMEIRIRGKAMATQEPVLQDAVDSAAAQAARMSLPRYRAVVDAVEALLARSGDPRFDLHTALPDPLEAPWRRSATLLDSLRLEAVVLRARE